MKPLCTIVGGLLLIAAGLWLQSPPTKERTELVYDDGISNDEKVRWFDVERHRKYVSVIGDDGKWRIVYAYDNPTTIRDIDGTAEMRDDNLILIQSHKTSDDTYFVLTDFGEKDGDVRWNVWTEPVWQKVFNRSKPLHN